MPSGRGNPYDFFFDRIINMRNRHFLVLDIILLTLTPVAALMLRLDGVRPISPYIGGLAIYIIMAMTVRIGAFYEFGLYQRYWRYASIGEMSRIILAVAVSSLLVLILFIGIYIIPFAPAFLTPVRTLPRSIPLLESLLVLILVGGNRFSVRSIQRLQRRHNNGEISRPVAIMGAGDAGAMIVREMKANPHLGMDPVMFFDDDPDKKNMRIYDVPVVGNRLDIPDITQRDNIKDLIIAMPTASGQRIRDVVRIAEQTGLKTRIIPGMYELLEGDVSITQLRDVRIEDLLRREPIKTDLATVHALVKDKRVLVTGAGGSIGSELCRQIVKAAPASLILVGHGENSIFNIQNELRQDFAAGRSAVETIIPVIADVRDWPRLQQIFAEHNPEIVFHTAAHKHVPLMEANPIDAITNNILGTNFLLETCLTYEVERFVLISTDKAVNPANIMGVTKRTAELLVLNAAKRSGKPYVAVRFGNVLGSRGSVVPFFKKQIEAGGPVTVTHPEVTRYFMTIPEAVQLVLQAAAMGKAGDLFMLDMGDPIKIVDLANDLIRLSGLKPNEDIEIIFSGLRPGEKLHEDLYQGHEDHAPTEHEKILRVTSAYIHPANLRRSIVRLHQLSRDGKLNEALALIAALAPEYTPPPGVTPQRLIETKKEAVIPLHARWY